MYSAPVNTRHAFGAYLHGMVELPPSAIFLVRCKARQRDQSLRRIPPGSADDQRADTAAGADAGRTIVHPRRAPPRVDRDGSRRIQIRGRHLLDRTRVDERSEGARSKWAPLSIGRRHCGRRGETAGHSFPQIGPEARSAGSLELPGGQAAILAGRSGHSRVGSDHRRHPGPAEQQSSNLQSPLG